MNSSSPITVLIITKNEEKNLPFALASVCPWVRQVFVVDSGSVDQTQDICRKHGVDFVHHDWEGYARQKNWALTQLPFATRWIFILDADEVILPPLQIELRKIAEENQCAENGFYINRHFIFLNKRIRHCGFYPSWNLRFFRAGKARYEDREVHEHMVVDGPVGYLKHEMEHNDRRGLEYYIAKHNQYSTLEARAMFRKMNEVDQAIRGTLFGGAILHRRWIKDRLWPHLPARWLARWFYMYICRLGFLDGVAGFHFCLFMAAYEHQITLKLKELTTLDKQPRATPGEGSSDGN